MTAITVTDLDNAKLDVDHIAAIATSPSLLATDRLGNEKDTIAGAVYKITAFTNRGAWAATTVYAVKDLVSNGGSWYVAVVAHTSSAAFATDTATKWRLYQGVTTGDLSASSGAALVGFLPAGTGGVARTAQDKMREFVSVKDHGATGDGITDDTAAFVAAQVDAKNIYIPPGTYVIDNLRIQNGINLVGGGIENTILKQKTTGNYAVNCLSDVTTGQLYGLELSGFKMIGAVGATVAAMNIEANGIYAIVQSVFDYAASNTYSPLRMHCPDAGNVYNSKVKVSSNISTTGVVTEGVYNEYDFFLTGVADSCYIKDTSTLSVFLRVVTEGSGWFSGQGNRVINFTCELYPGPVYVTDTVLRIDGANQSFDLITITNVPSAKATSAVNIFGANTTVGKMNIQGSVAPVYPCFLSSGSSGSFGDVSSISSQKVDAYVDGKILRDWKFLGMVDTFLRAGNVFGGLKTVYQQPGTGDTIYFGSGALFNDWADVSVIDTNFLLATLTIILPVAPKNNQTARVVALNLGVTALTLTPAAGHAVYLAPTSLATKGVFELVFKASDSTWYVIG